MKRLFALFLLLSSVALAEDKKKPAKPPEMKCVEWQVQTKTVCVNADPDHTLGGAAVGFLVLGPVGALAGGLLGHGNDKQVCHQEAGEPVCTKYVAVEQK